MLFTILKNFDISQKHLHPQVYSAMNAAMRTSDPAQLSVFRPLIYYISVALKKLKPKTSTVYRGIPIPVNPTAYGPGTVVAWPAFSSTSADAGVGMLLRWVSDWGYIMVGVLGPGQFISVCSFWGRGV